jgi:hypothetical protein
MDLTKISQKLEKSSYINMDGFDEDVRLMFKNCALYNGATSGYGKVENYIHMYVYVCICLCVYIYMHTHIYMYINICI